MAPLVLGTSPDRDLVVHDPRVSRRHCELNLTERGVVPSAQHPDARPSPNIIDAVLKNP